MIQGWAHALYEGLRLPCFYDPQGRLYSTSEWPAWIRARGQPPGWTLNSERACWIFDGLYYSDPESRFALYARLQKPTGEYAEHYWPVVKPDSFSACWYAAWDGDAVVLAGAGIPGEQRLVERALTLAGARRVLVERGYAQESVRWPIWRRQAREVTGNQLAQQCSNNKPNREITQ